MKLTRRAARPQGTKTVAARPHGTGSPAVARPLDMVPPFRG